MRISIESIEGIARDLADVPAHHYGTMVMYQQIMQPGAVLELTARVRSLEAALIEALDSWTGFAEGMQSPTYQGPSERKGRAMLDRIAQLRALTDGKATP